MFDRAMLNWNWLDCILAVIVVASMLTAVMKGFVRELISLASVLIGLVLAAMGYSRAATWFDDLTKSHEIALGLGFLAIFLGTLILGTLAGLVARKLIKTAGIQWFDRLLGGIFGLVRGVLIGAILLLVMMAFAIKPEALQQSTLAPYIATGTRVIALVMPGSIKDQFHLGFEKFHDALVQSDRGLTPK